MFISEFLKFLADVLHSPIGTFLCLLWLMSSLIWLLSLFIPDQSACKALEGSIITAIKRAEKEGEAAPLQEVFHDKSLAKLEMALEFVLRDYARANDGKKPSAALTEQLRQAIQVKHHEMVGWRR